MSEDTAIVEELQKLVGDIPILNIYKFGSVNYGTSHEKSDRDYILIVDMKQASKEIYGANGVDLSLYNKETFEKHLNEQEIDFLEVIQHPVIEKVKVEFKLDLSKLRHSVSSRSDHSYIKAKKKLTVEKDRDPYSGKKSLFHAFRMLDYAIQLCKEGKISNWNVKPLYDEIMSLPEAADTWPVWEEKFKKRFNQLKTEFRKVAPKKT